MDAAAAAIGRNHRVGMAVDVETSNQLSELIQATYRARNRRGREACKGLPSSMRLEDVCVATITWARSEDEASVLLRGLSYLSRAGLPIVVADKGNAPAFAQSLRMIPGVEVYCETTGLVAQIRASVTLAARSRRPFILYVEPDKECFCRSHLTRFIARAPANAATGVVLASRTPRSFASFPPFQRFTESLVNSLCTEVFGKTGDYSYGPFLMTRDLIPYIQQCDDGLGWGWRHATFVASSRRSLTLRHITDDYMCPPDQRTEDCADRAHRLRQLNENLRGLSELPSARG